MLINFKLVWLYIFIFFSTQHVANGQGCNLIDKNALIHSLKIDLSLLPFLNLEVPSCSHIKLHDGYAEFILTTDNIKINNGVRTEIAIGYPFTEGDTVEYRWSIMLPEADGPGGNTRQWWLIAQWHDQPDPRRGETWTNFKSQSPPVAIYVEKRDDVVGIGLQGLLGKKLSWTPAPSNTWLDLTATIRWSTTGYGSVKLSVAGHPEFNFISYGKNMLNNYQHYFKAGQYRSPDVIRNSVIYLKDINFRKL